MKPQISVIIPVYNHAQALERALASLYAQTYRPLEVIIVDDGSDIKIKESVISRYETQKDFSITLLSQKNQGAPAARNAGFAVSKGEYVIFWDADIVGESNMLEEMHIALQKDTSVSFVYSNHAIDLFGGRYKKNIRSRHFDLQLLKQNNYIHSTSLLRRAAVLPWDTSLKRFQDWDIWLRIGLGGGSGVWIDKALFTIIEKGSMSTWLPRIAYRWPFRFLFGIRKKVQRYEDARRVVLSKHGIE
jgi:glycosyltransferase involved in cell wall biosynthesis